MDNLNLQLQTRVEQMVDNYHVNKQAMNLASLSDRIDEQRVIINTGTRQSGITTQIAHMFDPDKDLYVSNNGFLASDFADKFPDQTCKTATLNSNDFEVACRKVRGQHVRYVFIDVGPTILLARAVRIRKLIDIVDMLSINEDTFFIIT